MAYTPQTWQNNLAGGTPLSAARLNYMEAGIEAAAAAADDGGAESAGAFTFASGWSAAAAGGGASSVKKIGSLVTLTIAFKKSTDIAISGEGAATIPSGFRPPDLVWFAVGLDGATFSGNPTSALVRVTSGGAIEVYSATAGKRDVYGAVTYVSA